MIDMVRIFQSSALVLAGVTVYFLLNDDFDNAFVVGAFSIVSFLLSMRFQIKARLKEHENQDPKTEDI